MQEPDSRSWGRIIVPGWNWEIIDSSGGTLGPEGRIGVQARALRNKVRVRDGLAEGMS